MHGGRDRGRGRNGRGIVGMRFSEKGVLERSKEVLLFHSFGGLLLGVLLQIGIDFVDVFLGCHTTWNAKLENKKALNGERTRYPLMLPMGRSANTFLLIPAS